MYKYFLFAVALLLGLSSCKKEEPVAPQPEKKISYSDSVKQKLSGETVKLQSIVDEKGITYSVINRGRLYRYSGRQQNTILLLNRVDRDRLRNNRIVVPGKFYDDFRTYSPFPFHISQAEEIPRLILVSQKVQAIGLFEYGYLVRWGPTSTGKEKTPTPTGLFHTNWKAQETTSTFNDEWNLKWCFNLDNFEGVSLHQYELPGNPESHSCVRLKAEDAEFIYYWAQQWVVTPDGEDIVAYGTPVIIFDKYDFENPYPWLRVEDVSNYTVSPQEAERVVTTYKSLIISRQKERDSVISKAKRMKELKKIYTGIF